MSANSNQFFPNNITVMTDWRCKICLHYKCVPLKSMFSIKMTCEIIWYSYLYVYNVVGVIQKDDLIHFCHQNMTLSGQCHESPPSKLHMDQGNFPLVTCFDVFNAKYGASAMTQRCTCQNLPQNKHTCSCCINCIYTDGKSRCQIPRK